MDFWGFDRSHRSLRLDTLVRILKCPTSKDIDRLGHGASFAVGTSPLTSQEIELLIALSNAANKHPDLFDGIQESLYNDLLAIPSLTLYIPSAITAPAKLPFIERVGLLPSRDIAKQLTAFFIKKQRLSVFNDFLDAFDSVWTSELQAPSSAQAKVGLGALLGFLEGIIDVKSPESLDMQTINRINKYCKPEFLASAHSKISSRDVSSPSELSPSDETNLDTEQISASQIFVYASEISALFSSTAGDQLKELTNISIEQLERLENSHRFQTQLSLDQMKLIEEALSFHLKTVEVALSNDVVTLSEIQAIVLQLLSDPAYQYEPLISSITELVAKVIDKDEHKLYAILPQLPDFFGELESSTSYHSACKFAEVLKLNFSLESSRINILYAFTNKLNSEEYKIYATTHGDAEAVAYISSLLSALMGFVVVFNSHELANLLCTLLDQKYGVINDQVDCQIIETWGLLAPYLTHEKFVELLDTIALAVRPDNPETLRAIKNARISIAKKCQDSQLYLEHLLNLLVIRGNPSYADVARGIFAPLAELVARNPAKSDMKVQESSRNAWFSLASMGFTMGNLESEDLKNLSIIAKWAPPLITEASEDKIDSDIHLNPVLVRGTSPNVLKSQKAALAKVDNRLSAQNSTLKTMFMAAVLLLEGLRSRAGVVSQLPYYFAETDLATGEGYNHMHLLVMYFGHEYVRALGNDPSYTLMDVSNEVKHLVILACHRIESISKVSAELVSLVVSTIPAALCKQHALFAVLDCINLLGSSVTNAIEDVYSPQAVFTSTSGITIELSDCYEAREQTLRFFEENAFGWLSIVTKRLNTELKPRLCSYIGSGSTNSGRGRKFALSVLSRDESNDNFISQYILLNRYDSMKTHTLSSEKSLEPGSIEGALLAVSKLRSVKSSEQLRTTYEAVTPYIHAGPLDAAIVIAEECVKSAFRLFDAASINAGIEYWSHIVRNEPKLRATITNQVTEQCILTARNKQGIFSRELDDCLPLWSEMEYAPSNKEALDMEEQKIKKFFEPHSRLLNEFIRGSFHSSVLVNPLYTPMFNRLAFAWLRGLIDHGSLHSIARNLRLEILGFVNEIVTTLLVLQKKMITLKQTVSQLQSLICRAGISWYQQPVCQWPYGSNRKAEAISLNLIRKTLGFISGSRNAESRLLTEFLSQEYNKLSVWHSPLGATSGKLPVNGFTTEDLQVAWELSPILVVRIATTWDFMGNGAAEHLLVSELVEKNIMLFVPYEEALPLYLERRSNSKIDERVLYWTQISPITSINLLSPAVNDHDTIITQLALRSLQSHPIVKCFFYVPQIVQQLRHDESGWVEEYILEAAKFSQKFAHQIIWNLLANMYNDDDGTIPNDMKPKLEEVLEKMKNNFNAEEKEYYETEFKFFAEVTGISGKLKPYIKKSKAEKKVKIDEEMAQIEVPDDVYLPSHPDGTVVDIDRLSGKPLQSHAKAPFMATFKLKLDKQNHAAKNGSDEIWQSAIFKVGDDCRQDVLALQIISVFRSIFNYCGLDVFVFPYKVTATNAGRGIIDVLPNSVSRDMLGREAVNGLDQWFRSKYGGPESIAFQRARLDFVKSLAAYSVISYLIQFKDRHNGNIMYDADGHIIHIDFGFCFDITPGGVRFEAAPFKLTKEMVQVMGGSPRALPYKWFEEQCVRAYLASRVFADDICRVVEPMLESGLPCFKGQTIRHLRERFALQKSDAEAAQFMRHLISKSHESNYTKGYDEFQRITNGIPH